MMLDGGLVKHLRSFVFVVNGSEEEIFSSLGLNAESTWVRTCTAVVADDNEKFWKHRLLLESLMPPCLLLYWSLQNVFHLRLTAYVSPFP